MKAGIQYEYDYEAMPEVLGINRPKCYCHACGKEITKGEGTVWWTLYEDQRCGPIYFTCHRGGEFTCNRKMMAFHRLHDDGLLMSEYIVPFLRHLGNNVKRGMKVKDKSTGGSQSKGLRKRFKIFKRDGYRCRICGKSADEGARLEVDHMHPRAAGGSDEPDNLWTLCFECNRGKSDELLWAES